MYKRQSIALKGVLSTMVAVVIFAIGTAFAIRGATGIFNSALMAVSSPFNGRVSDFFSPILGATIHLFISLKSKWAKPKQQAPKQPTHAPAKSRIERPTTYQEPDNFAEEPVLNAVSAPAKPSIAKTTLVGAVTKIADSLKSTPETTQQTRIEPQFEGPDNYNEPMIDQEIEPYAEADYAPNYEHEQEPQDVQQPMAPNSLMIPMNKPPIE